VDGVEECSYLAEPLKRLPSLKKDIPPNSFEKNLASETIVNLENLESLDNLDNLEKPKNN
jgi:hypothetical protein